MPHPPPPRPVSSLGARTFIHHQDGVKGRTCRDCSSLGLCQSSSTHRHMIDHFTSIISSRLLLLGITFIRRIVSSFPTSSDISPTSELCQLSLLTLLSYYKEYVTSDCSAPYRPSWDHFIHPSFSSCHINGTQPIQVVDFPIILVPNCVPFLDEELLFWQWLLSQT